MSVFVKIDGSLQRYETTAQPADYNAETVEFVRMEVLKALPLGVVKKSPVFVLITKD